MNKLFTLLAATSCAMSVCAASGFEVLNPEVSKQLKPATLEWAGESTPSMKAPATNASEAPETLVGKSFVTLYNDGTDNYNHYFNVSAIGDSLLLEGFAEGFDVKAAYNSTTGTLTIPTGIVVGEHSTYGPVTMYAAGATQYSDDDIIGTVNGNTITFNFGVYGIVTYQGQPGGLILMQEINAVKANGQLTASILGTTGNVVETANIPLLINKIAEDKINIVGLSSLFYGKLYNVPATFNMTTNLATINTDQPIDWSPAANNTGAKDVYYMLKRTDSGLDYNPEFNISNTETSSSLAATTNIFIGYDTNGAGSYRGFSLTDYKIEADFNIYTAEIDDDFNTDVTEVTVDGIIYGLNNDELIAEVTGCLGTAKVLNIAPSVEANDKTYAVTSVAASAFQGKRTITSVVIPNSIKTIGRDAFRNLAGIKEVHLPNILAWCEVKMENGNANPIYNLFSSYSESKWGKLYIDGSEMTDIVIPEGVTEMERTFYGYKKLSNITLPSTLKTLGDQTFANCIALKSVAVPASVESLGSAFFGCEGLETVNIPAGVDNISSTAFYSCKNLKELTSSNPIPPVCSNDYTFDDCKTAKLIVPAESIDAYKAATGWKVFTVVEAIDTSAIESINDDDNNAPAEYYNLQGMKVSPEHLTPGFYIMHKGNKTTKVYVK